MHAVVICKNMVENCCTGNHDSEKKRKRACLSVNAGAASGLWRLAPVCVGVYGCVRARACTVVRAGRDVQGLACAARRRVCTRRRAWPTCAREWMRVYCMHAVVWCAGYLASIQCFVVSSYVRACC